MVCFKVEVHNIFPMDKFIKVSLKRTNSMVRAYYVSKTKQFMGPGKIINFRPFTNISSADIYQNLSILLKTNYLNV